jgi:hypothetical protein
MSPSQRCRVMGLNAKHDDPRELAALVTQAADALDEIVASTTTQASPV